MSTSDFVERFDVTDTIASTHNERLRAVDYSDERLYPTEKLEELGIDWMTEEENPDRSPRSQKEAAKICKLIAFECAYRKGQVQVLIDFYGGQHE